MKKLKFGMAGGGRERAGEWLCSVRGRGRDDFAADNRQTRVRRRIICASHVKGTEERFAIKKNGVFCGLTLEFSGASLYTISCIYINCS